ncbi:carboxymuconolactone decarboxylase family protein [Mycobacterium sp. MBM]|nr:carboxymuconolactone decarboxylase family protein [Mycobacterium sp. MBM]
MDDLRRQGLAKMNAVYGWQMTEMPGDYFALTVDHLFADIWSRPGLSMRDRRIMVLTVVTALGNADLTDVQVSAALATDELSEEELREMAIFLTHYLGFPLGSRLEGAITAAVNKKDANPASSGSSDIADA